MISQDIQSHIQKALETLGITVGTITLEHPADISHGDYSTNVALAHAKQASKNPRVLAEEIVASLSQNMPTGVEKIDIAGPGFINFHLSKEFFTQEVKEIQDKGDKWGTNSLSKGKKIMVEYTDPNPFKPFHIGHLMTNAIGESVARIFSASGARVVRANYQGDVGLHVAKAIWAILKNPIAGYKDMSASVSAQEIGIKYALGSDAYENDASAKAEIDAINKKVYDRSDSEVNDIYDWGRKVTLEAFEDIYAMLGTKFDHYFFESQMAKLGEQIVRENLGKVFEESDGAIIFKGEKHDPKLHTRVFINSQGLPTYETKEIGLTVTKFEKENPDLSIVITAIEQGEYMKVVQKALSIMHPDYESRMKHITHGMMRFASGKMSSRKGNVVTGESLLNDSKDVVHEKMAERDFSEAERATIASQVGVSALKYSILKQAIGGDIIYDFEKSISFDGDSGPYLQYTVVRASALLEKAKNEGIKPEAKLPYNWQTTSLEKHLYRYPEIVERAYLDMAPHTVATYLTELASLFNSFYAGGKIVDTTDQSSPYKLALTEAFRTTMKNGLALLGIESPERM